MKNIYIILFVLLLIPTITVAQTENNETVNKLNSEAVTAYQEGKFSDAVKIAKKALDVSFKVNGKDSMATAVIYTNLGVIFRDFKKYKESAENFQKSLVIHEKTPNVEPAKLLDIYQNLAISQELSGKISEAEKNYLKTLKLSEDNFGQNNKDSLSINLRLAVVYAMEKKIEKADEYYAKSFKIAKTHFGSKSKELDLVKESRYCSIDASIEQNKKYLDSINDRADDNEARGNIVNGKAINLVKPRYPQEAKDKGISGTAKIQVTIDDQGNVIEAKARCGEGVLEKAAIESSLQSKFSPTLFNGVPIKIVGTIVYRFAPPTQRIVALPISRPF